MKIWIVWTEYIWRKLLDVQGLRPLYYDESLSYVFNLELTDCLLMIWWYECSLVVEISIHIVPRSVRRHPHQSSQTPRDGITYFSQWISFAPPPLLMAPLGVCGPAPVAVGSGFCTGDIWFTQLASPLVTFHLNHRLLHLHSRNLAYTLTGHWSIIRWWDSGSTAYIWMMGTRVNSLYLDDGD